ncbi:MAG TPA: hypothetical protein VKU90_12360 [Caulobacteraceae bacterium]|nr:hypothetical protein [Caulobacteraceae bacterium]
MPLKHILIAAPTMAGLMKAKTATTLVMLMRQLTRAGVEAEYLNIDSSDIVYARNYFARQVLESKDLDGLLFVDSDMQFRPALVLKMLAREADVVGAAYPKRSLDLETYADVIARGGAQTPRARAKALSNVYQYTVVPSWETPQPGRMKVARGFARMAAVGMGCTLISRAALEAMVEAKAVERRRDIIDGVDNVSWGFFDVVKVGDISLSEDFSFCYRWTRLMGRDLWVCVDEPITHLGDFAFQARYMDRLVPLDPSPGVTVTTAGAPVPAPAAAPNSNAVEIDIDLLS